ncbi:MAG TPA: hypothetical protein VF627_08525 [Abditibacterium sp.]|jgi:hypothetical protein
MKKRKNAEWSDKPLEVQRLYEVFSRYQATPGQMQGCPCCVSDEDVARLFAKPLTQLTDDDLSRYSGKAITTWGDEDEFKHFLPRLLELALETGEVDFIGNKFPLAGWPNWNVEEVEAISCFFHFAWKNITIDDDWKIDDWIGALYRLNEDLMPFFREWLESPTEKSASFITSWVISENFTSLPNDVQKILLIDVKQRLETQYLEHPDTPDAIQLAEAVDYLHSLRGLIHEN